MCEGLRGGGSLKNSGEVAGKESKLIEVKLLLYYVIDISSR